MNVAFPVMLDQAVSFFFVLSGFILTYVHPSLAPGERSGFLWARLARVWPGHVAAFLLVVALFGAAESSPAGPVSPAVLVANLSLTQAWVPVRRFFFSFNGVSWSISVEAFFYLTFPFLIHRWQRTWFWKLPLALLAALGLVGAANVWQLPVSASAEGIGAQALVYINPIARWFEFVLGMTGALAWAGIASRIRLGRLAGTLIELGAVALVGLAMYRTLPWASAAASDLRMGAAGAVWLLHGPIVAPWFALLVVVMALEHGLLSRALSHPFPVLLGEISYSVYLVHFTLLRYYWANLPTLAASPSWLGYSIFWLLLLLVSHLMWRVVERPARSLLVALWAAAPTGGTGAGDASPTRSPLRTRATVSCRWAFAELLVVVGLVCLLRLWEAGVSAPRPQPSSPREGVTRGAGAESV